MYDITGISLLLPFLQNINFNNLHVILKYRCVIISWTSFRLFNSFIYFCILIKSWCTSYTYLCQFVGLYLYCNFLEEKSLKQDGHNFKVLSVYLNFFSRNKLSSSTSTGCGQDGLAPWTLPFLGLILASATEEEPRALWAPGHVASHLVSVPRLAGWKRVNTPPVSPRPPSTGAWRNWRILSALGRCPPISPVNKHSLSSQPSWPQDPSHPNSVSGHERGHARLLASSGYLSFYREVPLHFCLIVAVCWDEGSN